jgi:hypothetical protein
MEISLSFFNRLLQAAAAQPQPQRVLDPRGEPLQFE